MINLRYKEYKEYERVIRNGARRPRTDRIGDVPIGQSVIEELPHPNGIRSVLSFRCASPGIDWDFTVERKVPAPELESLSTEYDCTTMALLCP